MTALRRSPLAAHTLADVIGSAPASVLHLVVDASAVPNFVHMADAFGCRRICLFDGAPGEELADVAPHLVEIDPADTDCHDYLWDCIAEGNAIVMASPLPALRLKTFLKRFLRRRMDGAEYYVKFYTANNFLFLIDSVAGFSRFFESVDMVMAADPGPGRTMQVIRRSEGAAHG